MRCTFFFRTLAVAVAASTLTVTLSACVADSTGASNGPESAPPTTVSEQSAVGRVGSHGMVLAGAPSAAVLSHIPTFAAPHDVQLLVAGTLVADAGGPVLPSTFSDRTYTFVPERTSLDALRTGVTRELHGTVYLGNFEQGGRPLATARFAVGHVVHQHVLTTGGAGVTAPSGAPDGSFEAAAPRLTDGGGSQIAPLTYVVFGSRSHAFAAHHIDAAPSFDEVLAVGLAADAPSDADLARGVTVQLVGSPDAATSRLGLRPDVTATVTASDGGRRFMLRPATTLSCLTGPDFVGTCS
jgi:hypothetical protein